MEHYVLGPDGVDRWVGHALEEPLEEPDPDEERGAGPRAERRDEGEHGGGGDARQEDALAAVHGGLDGNSIGLQNRPKKEGFLKMYELLECR